MDITNWLTQTPIITQFGRSGHIKVVRFCKLI